MFFFLYMRQKAKLSDAMKYYNLFYDIVQLAYACKIEDSALKLC